MNKLKIFLTFTVVFSFIIFNFSSASGCGGGGESVKGKVIKNTETCLDFYIGESCDVDYMHITITNNCKINYIYNYKSLGEKSFILDLIKSKSDRDYPAKESGTGLIKTGDSFSVEILKHFGLRSLDINKELSPKSKIKVIGLNYLKLVSIYDLYKNPTNRSLFEQIFFTLLYLFLLSIFILINLKLVKLFIKKYIIFKNK